MTLFDMFDIDEESAPSYHEGVRLVTLRPTAEETAIADAAQGARDDWVRTSRRQSPLGPPEYPENESVKAAGVESHASYQVKTGHPGSVYCRRDIFHRALDHLRVPFRP
jgi:hypothetical protein